MPRAWRRLVLSLLLLPAFAWACDFRPVARRAKPEQITTEPMRLVRSLDLLGEHVLVSHTDGAGEQRTAIYGWREDERCDLPDGVEKIGRSLLRPARARGGPVLWLPLVIQAAGSSQLLLIDEHCKARGPYGEARPDTLRTLTSREDRRGFLVFQDSQATLWLLDPWRQDGPVALADEVGDVQVAPVAAGSGPDTLWILEGSLLTQRDLSGDLLTALGEQVTAFALAQQDTRVAYVDGDTVYEAVGPGFAPVRLASDACTPRYGNKQLDFFSPCADHTLQRRDLTTGAVRKFPAGVFASVLQEGLQLDYVQRDETTVELFAESTRFARRQVEPMIALQRVYILDDHRIAGLSASGGFAAWDGVEQSARELLQGVDTIVPHYRGKKHRHAWLVRHDVSGALGSLSLLTETDLQPKLVAADVPPAASGGFSMDRGAALPNYPFGEPIVVLIEAARPLAADPARFKGRLRALLLFGTPSGDLAEDVSSYLLIASPVPGVLYGVEEAAEQGVWFVAL